MRLQMIIQVWRSIAVGEAGCIGDVARSVGIPRQGVLRAHMQSVPLVVIEEAKSIAERKVGQPAIDVSKTESELIRIGEINLCAITNARRTHGDFPPADARPLNCDGEEQVRIIEAVVIEIIVSAS